MNGGISNDLAMHNSALTILPTAYIPSTIDAQTNYRGRLSATSHFGHDPLRNYESLQVLRNRDFDETIPNHLQVFQDILHGNVKDHIAKFIHMTENFCNLFSSSKKPSSVTTTNSPLPSNFPDS